MPGVERVLVDQDDRKFRCRGGLVPELSENIPRIVDHPRLAPDNAERIGKEEK